MSLAILLVLLGSHRGISSPTGRATPCIRPMMAGAPRECSREGSVTQPPRKDGHSGPPSLDLKGESLRALAGCTVW